MDRWPLINEETFSIGSLVEARWSTTAADESMVDGQGSKGDEGLSESNRASIAGSNRASTVTSSYARTVTFRKALIAF